MKTEDMRKNPDGGNMRKYRVCVAALMAVFAFLFAGCTGRQIPDFTSGAEAGSGSGGETGNETGKETEAEAKASGKKLSVLSTFPENQSTLTELMSGVEFVFDDNDINASDLESALSISPDIAGEIKRSPSGERWIFYPTVQKFAPNTRYTVTLDSSLTSQGGAKLPEAYTFSFTTGNEDQGYSFAIDRNNSGSATCFLPSELPTCFVYMDPQLTGNRDQVSVDVTLYRFDSIDRYCDALKRFSDDSSMSLLPEGSRDPSRGEGRTKLSAFTISAVSGESAGYTSYYHSSQYLLPFPDKLEAGQYLAEISVKTPSGTPETLTRYELLQSSPLSVYYMKSGDQMVAWLHDSETSKPVEKASVTADGDFKGNAVSDADGLARITDSSDRITEDKKDKSGRSLTIFRVDSGDSHFADARTGYEYNSEDPAQNKNTGKYFTYLYTDRNLYRNTDTIHFWGVLRPRNSQDAVPSSAEVRLGESWNDGTSLSGVKVTPDSDGMFQGEIKIDSMKTGYYDPCLYLDDDLLYSGQSLSVEEFVKPTYSVTTSMDKPVYLLSDPAYRSAVLHVDITYFDGTPASGFRGKIEADGRGAEISAGGDFVADANGHVEIPVTLGNSESNSCYPVQYSVAIENADAESENVYETQNITVIPRDVMLEAKYDHTAKEILVTTNRVNISGITEDSGYPDLKTLRGEALPCDITAQLYKVTYEKNQTGTTYDYVERKSVPQYSYDQKETLVKTENIRTDNGTSVISDLPDTSDQDSYYYYLLSAKDSAGNAVQRKVYLSYFYMYEGELSSHRYEMVKEDSTDIADSGLQEYEYNPSDNEFDSTQDLKMVLSSNHEKVDFPAGTGMMTAIVQSGIGKTEISSDGKRDIAFSEDLIPNFVIAGAYYDGKHTWPVDTTYMQYNSEERDLNINLIPDKENYAPGETVNVTASVSKKGSGEPAAGAHVLLSTVDESIFAMQDQSTDFPGMYYRSVYYPEISEYTSTSKEQPVKSAAEGGGGEGSARTRKDFKDTAYFTDAVADENGNAAFSFTMPDNVTSWRLTSLALSKDNFAGNVKQKAVSTLPYYVVPVVSSELLTGDSCSVGIRSAGRGISSSMNANYSVTVAGEGYSETKSVSAAAFDYASVSFPALAEGAYTVTVNGSCNDLSDSEELPLSVAASGIRATVSMTQPLSAALNVNPLAYPVEVNVYNKDSRIYNRVFSSLLCNNGTRADERIARKYTASLRLKNGDTWWEDAASESISDLDNVISLFPYSNPDVALSARAYLAAPQLLGSVSSGVRFEDVAGSGSGTGSAEKNSDGPNYTGNPYAVYLLQAEGKVKWEKDPEKILENDSSLSFEDKMYLVTALAAAGEADKAEKRYQQYVTPYLVKTETADGQTLINVNAGQNKSTDGNTAAALMAASVLKKEEAGPEALYLLEKSAKEDSYALEELLYLVYCQPEGGNQCSFSYMLDGEKHTETPDAGETFTLKLNKDQLKNIGFETVSGNPYMTVYYTGAAGDTGDTKDKKLGISMEMSQKSYHVGDTAVITLTPDLSGVDQTTGSSCMIVDVCLPSGMRYEKTADEQPYDQRNWWLMKREGQHLQFMIWNSGKGAALPSVTVKALCATPGDYVVESARISSENSSLWGMSDRSSVNIQ